MTGISLFFSSRRSYSSRHAVTNDRVPDSSSSSTCSGSRHQFNHNTTLARFSCVRQHRSSLEYDPVKDRSLPAPDPHPPSIPDCQPAFFNQGGSHCILATRNTEETLHTNIRVRPDEYGRLPGPVLLARQRLIEKLKGVCHSGNSEAESFLREVEGDDISSTLGSSSLDGTHIGRRMLHSTSPPYKKWNLGSIISDKIISLKERILSGRVGGGTVPSECSICLEEEEKTGEGEWTTLPCGHCFHLACLGPWLQLSVTCPYCRMAMEEGQV